MLCGFGCISSGVDVNQDDEKLWEFSGEVVGVQGNSQSSMSVVHSFSLSDCRAPAVFFLFFFFLHTDTRRHHVASRSLSRRRGGEKPSMCSALLSSLSSSLLFNHDSVNARTEAVLYPCGWLTQACSSSSLERRDRTLARIMDGSACCLCVSLFSLALTPLFFYPLLVTLLL